MVYLWQRAPEGPRTDEPASRGARHPRDLGDVQQQRPARASRSSSAIFGDSGLTVHVAIVSVHALTLLTILTVLVELDLRERPAAATATGRPCCPTALTTATRTVLHPVVLPVLLGLIWNLAGLRLPEPVDDVLQMLGQGVVPVCLVLIGLSLAHYGVRGVAWPALWLSAAKLLLHAGPGAGRRLRRRAARRRRWRSPCCSPRCRSARTRCCSPSATRHAGGRDDRRRSSRRRWRSW